MIRFKCLSIEELDVLEKQFVTFLSAQSILAPDWIKIKEQEPLRAQEIIEDFSNVVYGSVFSEANYLERRTRLTYYCYQCLSDRFVLVGLDVENSAEVDFRDLDKDEIRSLAAKTRMHVYTVEKPYTKDKADEVFTMMEFGCEMTDGVMFKVLASML